MRPPYARNWPTGRRAVARCGNTRRIARRRDALPLVCRSPGPPVITRDGPEPRQLVHQQADPSPWQQPVEAHVITNMLENAVSLDKGSSVLRLSVEPIAHMHLGLGS